MYEVYYVIDGMKGLERFEYLTHATQFVNEIDLTMVERYYVSIIDETGSTVCEVSNE